MAKQELDKQEPYVWLARLLTASAGERLEELLKGNNPSVIGSRPQDNSLVLSDFVDKFNPDNAPSKVEAFKWLENYKKMQKIRSYFMVGDSLESIAESINTLAFQPNTEEAYSELENNQLGSMEDYFAGDRPTMAIIRLPLSELERLITQGYTERRVGNYGLDTEKKQLDEITLGDDALRQIFQNNQFLYYGETHQVMNAISSMPFDPNNIFKYEYKPSISVGLENTNSNISFKSKKLSEDAKPYYDAFVEVMKNMPEEVRDDVLLTLVETLGPDKFKELQDYYHAHNDDNVM